MTERSQLAQDLAEVEKVNGEFYAAFERGDLDAMTEIWLDDPHTLCIHPGAEPLRGAASITRSWALIRRRSGTAMGSPRASATARAAAAGDAPADRQAAKRSLHDGA